MKKYYITIIFLISFVLHAMGQTYPIKKVDLGILSEDREGYYDTNLTEDTQFEFIFDITSTATVTFSHMDEPYLDFRVLSFENTDTGKQYSPHTTDNKGSYEYKLSAGGYKVIVFVRVDQDWSSTHSHTKVPFTFKVTIDVEKQEVQFGNLTEKKKGYYSEYALGKNTRYEIFFDITTLSSVTFTHGLDGGHAKFEMLSLENMQTGAKHTPHYTHDYIDYCDYEYKLKAGRYKITVLATIENTNNEFYFNCLVESLPEESKVDFGNLTEKFFDTYSANIDRNTQFEILFNITSFSSIKFTHTKESENVKFEVLSFKNTGNHTQYSPIEINDNGNYCDYKYELSKGWYKIIVLATVYDSPNNKVSFSCYAKDEAPPTPSLDTNKNYVKTRTYTKQDAGYWLDNIQYFDGLGRPNQTVQVGTTPTKKDLVALQEYDGFGRDSESWLPIAYGANGAYTDPSTIKTTAQGASMYNDQSPYAKPVYETSPLNRVLEQYGPGQEWHTGKKAVKTEYLTNGESGPDNGALSCRYYYVTGTGMTSRLHYSKTMYNLSELYVERTTDEDGNRTYSFTNKLRQLLLVRSINNLNGTIQHLNTLYIYDDFGNLCYVIPPLGFDKINDYSDDSAEMKQYAYIYKYDSRNRCIWKKLPGAEPIYYVYDKADQLIFTQDGEQRLKNEWTFTISDVFARNVLTGTVVSTAIKSGVCDNLVVKAEYIGDIANRATMGYKITGYAISPSKIYSANYYDNYNYRGKSVANNQTFPSYNFDKTQGADYNTMYGIETDQAMHKGLLTGSAIAQLDNANTSTFLFSTMYYDNRGRVIQTKSTNHLEGTEAEYIAYNFVGQPIKKKHVHTAPNKTSQTEIYDYAYDHAGRLLTTHHTLGGTKTLIAENSYDELGRLKTNKKGNHNNLATNYTYNIRSWITSMMSYHQHFYLDYTYGGNVKTQSWKQAGKTRKYTFEYDGLSRLLSATYTSENTTEKYGTSYSYDKHGNIMTIKRDGKTSSGYGAVDNLALTYNGNQLTKVRDQVTAPSIAGSADFINYKGDTGLMTYNANGALASDSHKGITSIQYNSLNLPTSMAIDNNMHKGKIEYLYSAAGLKLRTTHRTENPSARNMAIMTAGAASDATTETTKTDYAGNKIYENDKLKRILIDGGYIDFANNDITKPQYNYYLTDHLGNNRDIFRVVNGAETHIQRTHYYPFGMAFADQIGQEEQPYKYNGKELDTKLGLNTYDYSARYMDPAIGRFTSIDPHAENYFSWSPYVYVGNNPMRLTDPTGMDWSITQSTDSLGNTHYAMTVNGVLYNNSSNSNINMTDLLNAIVSQVNNAFTFSGSGFSVSMNMNLRMVTSVDDIKKTDHVFQVVDQSDLPGNNTLGMAIVNGLNILLSEQYVGDIINSNNIRTSAHELGHTGGLYDVNLNNNLGVQSVLTNLMTQTGYIQQNLANPSTATNLEKSQIEAIYNSYVNGGLNKYSPISRRINGFTIESTRSSVGPMPLFRFTYKNVLKK